MNILAALKTFIDPELGINIVDLGLVYHAGRVADGIDIELTMTTPACPLGEMMSEEIKQVLRDRFPEITDVRVKIVWDPPWSLGRASQTDRRNRRRRRDRPCIAGSLWRSVCLPRHAGDGRYRNEH